MTQGVSIRGRRFEVRWVHKEQDLHACRILLVSRSEGKRYGRILKPIQGANVLTVGETLDFLASGGAIDFLVDQDKPTRKENHAELVWNRAELLERVDNDQERLRDLLHISKEDFPRTIRFLEAAVASGDLKSSASLGHTLKGMLSNLGGIRAAAAAPMVEALASIGDRASLKEALDHLQLEAASLLPELDAHTAEVRR